MALLGKEGTVAVEASITEHYNDLIRELTNSDKEEHKELIETITRFRNEEQEHHDIGLENDKELAPAYQLLSGAIKIGFTKNKQQSHCMLFRFSDRIMNCSVEMSSMGQKLHMGLVKNVSNTKQVKDKVI